MEGRGGNPQGRDRSSKAAVSEKYFSGRKGKRDVALKQKSNKKMHVFGTVIESGLASTSERASKNSNYRLLQTGIEKGGRKKEPPAAAPTAP